MSTPTPDEVPGVAAFPFGEADPRLEDYLDDKLQSTADLGTVDVLLEAVAEQNRQLTEQLDDAARALDAARAGATDERVQLQARLDEFAALERTVAERLAAANADDAAPEAVVRRLTGPLQQLQRVTLAHDYLVLLQEVAALAAAARQALAGANSESCSDIAASFEAASAALPSYTRLRELATRLTDLRVPADEAAAHLVAHVGGVADAVWADIYAAMCTAFAALLAQRGWPTHVDTGVRADETWRDGFARLVELQALEICASHSATATYSPPTTSAALLPVTVMADFFVKEFRYHFLSLGSGRKTSDPRQIADVCFPWFLERVDTWAAFMRASFADLLAQQFAGTSAADKAVYTDPACAFVAALLPAMQEKVQQTATYAVQLHRQADATTTAAAAAAAGGEQAGAGGTDAAVSAASAGSSFLSSFIVELLTFDDALRSRFGYDGGYEGGPSAWPGLAGPVLDKHFPLWLQAEKDYTLARYRDIVDGGCSSSAAASASSSSPAQAANAMRAIDYDYNGPGKTKPTLAAVRVMDLLRGVTTQYARALKFGHRLRFLIDIQITVLDSYDNRLRDSLEAYYAMTSTVARTLHGVSREQLAALEGTGALEALCRVYGSADHVVRTLRDWGDDAFFAQLWNDLETRARAVANNHADHSGGGGSNQIVGGGLSASQVRQRTSAAMGGSSNVADNNVDGCLFDETIQAFSLRRKTAQEFLVTALAEANRKAFRPYVLRTHWTPVATGLGGADEDDMDAEDTPVPTDLAVTPELDEPLRVLHRNLGFLARALGAAVLRRTVRSALEKLQDLLWGEVLLAQRFTGLGAAQFVRDVGAVAAVAEQHVPRSGAALAGLQEGVQLLTLPVVAGSDSNRVTLLQANDRVFTDNTEAKRLLQELGLTLLTPANARLILQRRVETSA